MRWDVVLFLKGYPVKYRFGDAHYFMRAVVPGKLEALAQLLRSKLPGGEEFFDSSHPELFTAFGYRGDAKNQNHAIQIAQDRLAGFIDGVSLLVGHELPRLGSLVIVREGNDEGALIGLLFGSQWTYIKSNDQNAEDAWEEGSSKLFKQLRPFFDVVTDIHARCGTPLARQLIYSMKMYRHGVSAVMEGVEFICKWSALEGVVCAGAKRKRQTLLQRLSALFSERQAEIEATVANLWNVRNEAVHEARAFRSSQLTDSHPLVRPIARVDELFLGVVVFALAQLDDVDSLDALWEVAPTFTLPDFSKQIRPGRYRIEGTTWPVAQEPEGGKHLDALFAAGEPLSNPDLRTFPE